MKEIIELPDELLTYVKEKANLLANASLLLFEYILIPRDNYVEVTPEMRPRITDKIISYTIQNILGVTLNSDTKYTVSEDFFRYPEIDGKVSLSNLFNSQMSERLKNTLKFLIPDDSPVIEKGIDMFKLYVEHVLNEALFTLSDGDLDMDIKDILNNHSNIAEYLSQNINTDGDNVIFPKNYGFNDDDDNIIVQSFVWLMCGLNDWLDKDYIDEDDVKYMSKIMFRGLASDMLSDAEINEDVKINIKEALFLSDFFTSDKAANLMSKLFSNIKQNYDNEDISKIVKQFSIVI
jgi:hypothetical protein